MKKVFVFFFIISAGFIIGPSVFYYEHGEFLNSDKPLMLDIASENIGDFINKKVVLENACMTDFSLETFQNNTIKKEIIPLFNCDTIFDEDIKILLKIEPHVFGHINDVYSKGELSEYGMFVGKLENSNVKFSAGKERILKNSGLSFDKNIYELNSHFNPWEQYVEIWIFLFMFPVASIVLGIMFLKNKF